MMLVLSSTVFYGQKDLDKNIDSGVVLSLNEAEFFISQSTKADYFEPEYEMLSVKDSLNSIEIANLRNTNYRYDSIVSVQGSRLNRADTVINLAAKKLTALDSENKKLEKKNINKGAALIGSALIIIIETIILVFSFK